MMHEGISSHVFAHRNPKREEGYSQGLRKSRIGKSVESNDDSTRLPPPRHTLVELGRSHFQRLDGFSWTLPLGGLSFSGLR